MSTMSTMSTIYQHLYKIRGIRHYILSPNLSKPPNKIMPYTRIEIVDIWNRCVGRKA